jgi:hypothetical protein
VKEQTSVEGYGYGYGPGWRWSWADKDAQMNSVLQKSGTLVVDLVDARRNQLVWRGIAVDALDGRKDSRIRKGVARMFAKFPVREK